MADAEAAIETDAAYLEVLADELDSTGSDIQQWIDENPNVACTEAKVASGPSAEDAIELSCAQIAAVAVYETLTRSPLIRAYASNIRSTFQYAVTLFQGYEAAYTAGSISYAALVELTGAVVGDVLASVNIGWVAAAALAALAVIYVDDFIDCLARIEEPCPSVRPS